MPSNAIAKTPTNLTLKLWTCQHEEVLHTVQEQGIYRPDGRKTWRLYWREYGWMKHQLNARLPAPVRKPAPMVWAWLEKPTLAIPEGSVLLELQVNPQSVLLSCLDGWQHVLNNMYVPYDATDRIAWSKRHKDERNPLEVEASWTRIFNIPRMTALFRSEEIDHHPHIQAVFNEIHRYNILHTYEPSCRAKTSRT